MSRTIRHDSDSTTFARKVARRKSRAVARSAMRRGDYDSAVSPLRAPLRTGADL